MGLISKPNTFSAGAVIVASEHNDNYDTAYSAINGNIDNDNIKAAAAIALSKIALTTDATFSGDISFTNSATTDDVFTITADSLTTGSAMAIASNSADTNKRSLLNIANRNSAAKTASCLAIQDVASSCGIAISALGNGPHIRFLGDPTVSPGHDGDLWYTGSALNFRSGATTVDLLETVKGWVTFNGGGTPDGDGNLPLKNSYNVTQVKDYGTGLYGVYWNTDFANSSYAVVVNCHRKAGINETAGYYSVNAGHFTAYTSDGSNNPVDNRIISVIALGDR